jgi:hypothetical protein
MFCSQSGDAGHYTTPPVANALIFEIFLPQNGVGYILGDFFANASGHTG